MLCLQIHARVEYTMKENFVYSDDRNSQDCFCFLKIVFVFRFVIAEFTDIFFNLLALSICKHSFLDAFSWPF